jgi:(1->4)-alpha-D-glucan 1-alpha-D-glucosylmutase
MERYMDGEIDNLSRLLKDLSESDRRGHDFTFYNLKAALSGFMACLPVYRTYRSRSRKEFNDTDRAVMKDALAKALERKPELQRKLDLLGQFLLMPFESAEKWRNCIGFITRLQQFTGPLMAKGFEDTVLYCYNRLISLNEVGSSPEMFGTSIEEFHGFNLARSRQWPNSLNATATHDTKRGEDARARISILSEVPGEWAEALERWHSMNEPRRRRVKGRFVPDRNEEYFLYQTIMGALPFFAEDYPSFLERANGYLVKALREAKVHSDWMYPDTAYEEAYLSFFKDIMEQHSDFFEDMAAFTRKVAQLGMQNSLSQSLIKITSPGVPDFYQGTELWDFSFVDPDNRRPVNFEKRQSYLAEIIKRENDLPGLVSDLLAKGEDGRVKLFLIHRALRARKHNADLFLKGSYIPLMAEGPQEKRAIAFARVHKGSWAVTLAPRFPASQFSWEDTSITLPKGAPQRWRDAITGKEMEGRRIYLQEAFSHFPVSFLLGDVKR